MHTCAVNLQVVKEAGLRVLSCRRVLSPDLQLCASRQVNLRAERNGCTQGYEGSDIDRSSLQTDGGSKY